MQQKKPSLKQAFNDQAMRFKLTGRISPVNVGAFGQNREKSAEERSGSPAAPALVNIPPASPNVRPLLLHRSRFDFSSEIDRPVEVGGRADFGVRPMSTLHHVKV